MGLAVILFNDANPSEQIVNILSTKSIVRNLVKIGHVVLEKTFKDLTIIYIHAHRPGVREDNPQNFDSY